MKRLPVYFTAFALLLSGCEVVSLRESAQVNVSLAEPELHDANLTKKGNFYLLKATSSRGYVVFKSVAFKSFTLKANLSVDKGRVVGVIVHYLGENAFVMVNFYQDLDAVYVYAKEGNSFKEVGHASLPFDFSLGTPAQFEIKVKGSSLKVYSSKTLVGEFTLPYDCGYLGVQTEDQGAVRFALSFLSVESFASEKSLQKEMEKLKSRLGSKSFPWYHPDYPWKVITPDGEKVDFLQDNSTGGFRCSWDGPTNFLVGKRFSQIWSGYGSLRLDYRKNFSGDLIFIVRTLWGFKKLKLEGDGSKVLNFKNWLGDSFLDLSGVAWAGFRVIAKGAGSFVLRSMKLEDSLGVYGPGVQVETGFYEKTDGVAKALAESIKRWGYTQVSVLTWLKPENDIFLKKFKEVGLKVSLAIFPMHDQEAYEEHPEWAQVFLGGGCLFDWRINMAYNCPYYRDYYFGKLAKYLSEREDLIDAVDVFEVWYEVWGGPYPDNPQRKYYADLSKWMREPFKEKWGVDPLEMFENETSPHYFLKDKDLYWKWVYYRAETITDFLKALVSKIKEAHDVPVRLLYLPDVHVEPGGTYEYYAQNLTEWVTEVKDAEIMIQTPWQEWVRSDLPPDYVKDYADYYRKVVGDRPLLFQADIGSLIKRGHESWIMPFTKYCFGSGFQGFISYEFSIADYSGGRSDYDIPFVE